MKSRTLPFDDSLVLAVDQNVSIVARSPHEASRDWESMSVDDLWRLHEIMVSILSTKIVDEKHRLEERLRRLDPNVTSSEISIAKRSKAAKRRPYPQVTPKYRNPANPTETWSGRGKQPRWLSEQISLGKNPDEFRIK